VSSDAGAGAEQHDAAERAVHLLGAVAARLHDVLPELARVVVEVGSAWPDGRGREWTERASLVHRSLTRDLDAVLAGIRAAEALVPGAPLPRAGARSQARGPGPRLGDTEAERAADERGMRVPTLDEPG
jgi:hypothetical protein